jgi:hypothetical protein
MSKKLNCWEFKNCGREPGGARVHEEGICPAATFSLANGMNGGKNGGRICWAIAGTFCNEKIRGSFAEDQFTCMVCDFFRLVEEVENISNYHILTPLQLNEFLASRRGKTHK